MAGGVGGSRLVAGLAAVLDPDQLTVVVNTGDDFEHLGVWIQPDVDTVLYRLAGVQHPEHGWGRADATWAVMDAVADLDGPTWFRLGDQDLATSLLRSQWRHDGVPLGEIVTRLADRLGVAPTVLPMSEDVVATRIHTVDGADLAFQDWFVAHRAEPPVASLEFRGADVATAAPGVVEAIARADLVLLAPSNPFLSIDPIRAIDDIRDALHHRSGPTVAVSPIVGGRALKGPAAQLLADFGLEVSAVGVADHLGDLLTGFVLDEVDADRVADVTRRGMQAWATDTVMVDASAQRRLATWLLDTVGPEPS
nr:2-phospho-L-lactate transferase [Salsipaludibacter albus]